MSSVRDPIMAFQLGLCEGRYDCLRGCCGTDDAINHLKDIIVELGRLSPRELDIAMALLCNQCRVPGLGGGQTAPQLPGASGPAVPGQSPPGTTPPNDRLRTVACSPQAQALYLLATNGLTIARPRVSAEWQRRIDLMIDFVRALQRFCSDAGASVQDLTNLCQQWRELRNMISDAATVPALGLAAEALRALLVSDIGTSLDAICGGM